MLRHCTPAHTLVQIAQNWAIPPLRSVIVDTFRSKHKARVDELHPADPLGPPAFVFDIDGVLIRGKEVLAAARKAIHELTYFGGSGWRYPVCFLTNGGGVSEAKKAQQLAGWLDADITADQDLVACYADVPVLIAGRGEIVEVATNYGFKRLLTTEELGRAMPGVTPFSTYQDATGQSGPCPVRDLGLGTDSHPIRAVLVMTDPSDWYRDLQLITDVILSHGTPMRLKPAPGSLPVDLFFSNPDLLWANEFPRPRFGQGAFSLALNALHQELTGRPLNAQWFGKPNPQPYRLIERLLVRQAVRIGLLPDSHPAAAAAAPAATAAGPAPALPSLPFGGIYAVGDNPAADVRGARRCGAPWVPVLVRTGVFSGDVRELAPEDRPALVVDDVLGAVTAALHRTRSARWHSMR